MPESLGRERAAVIRSPSILLFKQELLAQALHGLPADLIRNAVMTIWLEIDWIRTPNSEVSRQLSGAIE